MKMTMQPTTQRWDAEANGGMGGLIDVPNTDSSNVQGPCDRCGLTLYRYRGQGDIHCPRCDANYNCFGQRLRDDLRTRINPSSYDDDIDDLTGDELSHLQHEHSETGHGMGGLP